MQTLQEETDVLRAENHLLRGQARQGRVWLEHSPVCTKVLDLDFRLKYMSQAGVQALKLEDAERYYCKPYPLDFFPEFFRTGMLEKLEQVRQTGEVAHQEAPIVTLGGVERWFRSIIAPVNDEEGNIENIMVVSIDITNRMHAEEHRMELERQVQHSQKLESLGVLSGGIAHDFNNLLMSVLGNADLALDALEDGHPAADNLLEVERAARRGAELADQMLAYSGRGKFVIEPIHLGELIAEMAHLLEVSISKKTELRLDFPTDLPTFDGDPTQIRQVIMNLLTNAAESLGEEGGVIHASAGTMDCDRAFLDEIHEALQAGNEEPLPEGTYVYLEVADNGSGMDAITRSKVFEPFFTTKFTGRGLGMSATLGIVRGHDGTIRICTESGMGSSFRVFFPVSPDAGYPSTSETATCEVPESWRGNGTILIADDEEAVRAVGQEMLMHFGFQVLQAADGQEALDQFQEHQDGIHCVLLDLTMPELDGEQVFRAMQAMRPEIPVILTSGYNLPDITERFRSLGLAGFLQKPFDLAALREELAQVLDTRLD